MTTPNEETIKPPKRRLLRLSVRALMGVVLVLAVALGWVINRARVQREAVAAIEKSGGKVFYDWDLSPGKGLKPKGQSSWPKWLVAALGVDYFGTVVAVRLGMKATDADMEQVGRLYCLKAFNAAQAKEITDVGIVHLAGLRQLEGLDFTGKKLSGTCLTNFRGMTQLKYLNLAGVNISDADLVNFAGLTNLTTIDLSLTSVSDAGFARLKQTLPQLRTAKEVSADVIARRQARAQAAAKNPGTQP